MRKTGRPPRPRTIRRSEERKTEPWLLELCRQCAALGSDAQFGHMLDRIAEVAQVRGMPKEILQRQVAETALRLGLVKPLQMMPQSPTND